FHGHQTMAKQSNIKQQEILDAVMKVKHYHYNMYQVRSRPEKTCQWCNGKIDSLESFCSKECESNHEAAVAEYESRREEKEKVNRSR
ncbi:hypothetical protein, partial [Endozoicomonas sp.]|uniref:hypothetical protein n=1 Tax=Endozoicomonas sp. TaxID=1892382 RepID=UPI00383BC366